MKQTKKDRLALLKTATELGEMEFAQKSGISYGTIWNIENGGNPSPKTEKTLIKAFNLNREWWNTGKGEMFSDKPQEEEATLNPWREEAYKALKEEVAYLRKMLETIVGNPNFQEATDLLRAA